MWKLLLTFSLLCWTSEGSVTCRNENNGEVDWYILYKMPKTNTLQGLENLYIDPDEMKTAMKTINDPQGVLANTLKPLFKPVDTMPPNFGFISYSDQPPSGTASQNFGHSKGVRRPFSRGTDQGIILPRFQTTICVSSGPVCPPEKDQERVPLLPKSLSNLVGLVFPDFRQPLHGYCCIYGIHPFEVTTRSPNAMTFGPSWCLGSHRICFRCEGSSHICNLVWCLFLSL
uniref:deoxyribonuclease II n=1 Tax=Astatotilapia calliptera TaxID=8154 RepID=A0AAX7UYC8_ASTCA